MTLLTHYQACIERGEFTPDQLQYEACVALDKRTHQLMHPPAFSWLPWRKKSQSLSQGLYLWGGVGRGKTWLMELFYHALPIKTKKQFHFHRLMQWVHEQLSLYQGQTDPLEKIVRKLVKNTTVLCLDELFVSDIADAMILAEFFRHLTATNCLLIITSNVPPKNLYWNGLQRSKFLPAIALLEQHLEVFHLDSPTDYRFKQLSQTALYYHPLTVESAKAVEKITMELAPMGKADQTLQVLGRTIPVRYQSDSLVWFTFEILCKTDRSYLDYIEIARCYHTVVVTDVTVMTVEDESAARRFIALIDELYARNVICLISAEAPIEAIYQGKRHQFEFERAQSRLIHMQQPDYLQKPHLP